MNIHTPTHATPAAGARDDGATARRRWTGRGAQWLAVGALLLLCLAKGLWLTRGLAVPADEDIVRDLGAIQGFLDGNLFGDPLNAGEWRWYPPLLHGLAAAAIALTGAAALPAWTGAGPWLGLLGPLCFFLMNRRLIGGWAAVAATAVLVLFEGALFPPDAALGYTPFTLTPALAMPLFLLGVLLVRARAPRPGFGDAALLGGYLGLAFLAHTVPAVFLSAMVATVALATRGPTPRTLLWLALVALLELGIGMLFLGPLLAAYRLHIANPAPGEWVHDILALGVSRRFALANLLGLAALATVLALRPRGVPGRVTWVILATWIGVSLVFLGRHYACGWLGIPAAAGGACGTFVIAAHHYAVHLLAAWASLMGLAAVLVLRRWWPRWPGPARAGVALAAAAALLLGAGGFLRQPWDLERRNAARDRPDELFDLAAYHWMLRDTAPRDLFATPVIEQRGGFNMTATSAVVAAAGRRIAGAPALHANPYLEWPSHDRLRREALAAMDGAAGGEAALCALVRAAGPDASAFLLAPADAPAGSPRLRRVFAGRLSAAYRVLPDGCDAPPAPRA